MKKLNQLRRYATLSIILSFALALAPYNETAFAMRSNNSFIRENPQWKILILIYRSTNVTYTDSTGQQHHLIAQLEEPETMRLAAAATRFVVTDIPALTSGFMQPLLTIRYPDQPLSALTSTPCNDYSPSPVDTLSERDQSFDSVIALYDGSGVDALNNNQMLSVVGCAYSWPMGTEPTYAAIPSDFIGPNLRNTNVFKHEWGHSILSFFAAAGTAPQPDVNNHINDTDVRYVNCLTGDPYVLVDEDDDNLIPNSIYNNLSGFTHDYYSGQTATADQPTRCLGINQEAWRSGGPVTRPILIDDTRIYIPIVRR